MGYIYLFNISQHVSLFVSCQNGIKQTNIHNIVCSIFCVERHAERSSGQNGIEDQELRARDQENTKDGRDHDSMEELTNNNQGRM